MTGRDYLLDVSRLIWRRWSGRLPTGIDRVCLEYVEHFGSRSQAVIQWKSRVFVLSPADSDRLFDLIRSSSARFRRQLVAFAPLAVARGSRSPPRRAMMYLNVGHTGLDQPGLVQWIARHEVRAVYLIHDLIPITHPQFCRPGEAEKHRLRTGNALVSAAGLICNSEYTREALVAFSKEVDLILPPTVVSWISGPTLQLRAAPKTLERPYFVTLGTIEGRKNHLLLLRIWQSMAATMEKDAPRLVIIGQRGWEADEAISILESDELKGHVFELARCDDEELARWLAGARALLMPSFVEGFGLPVVEALHLRVPVIASDLPVYREIVGDFPTYLDPSDSQEWERAIREFMGDGPERQRQIAALPSYRGPNWRSHFAAVEDWLGRF